MSLIRLFRTFVFITPPTPKAGTILHIRATELINQFFLTWVHRLPQDTLLLWRLYRSSPSRWIGVLNNCKAAGAINCAALALLTNLSISVVIGKIGPSNGGKL